MASIDEHVLTAGPGWKPLGFDVLRFARFLTVGGLAAGTNFTSRFAWSLVLLFAGSPLPIGVQARNFAIVNAIGATLTFLTATLLVRGVFPAIGFTWHAETIGHALAIVVPVATSWIGHRRFTFARAG